MGDTDMDQAGMTYSEQRDNPLAWQRLALAVLAQAIRDTMANYLSGVRVKVVPDEVAGEKKKRAVYRKVKSMALLRLSEPYRFLTTANAGKAFWCEWLGLDETLVTEYMASLLATEKTIDVLIERIGFGNTSKLI